MSSFSTPYVSALQTFYNDLGEKYDKGAHSVHGEGPRNLVDAAGQAIQESSWVLDLATGTGNVAFAAASKVGSTGRVLGIDISDKFLEHAQRKAEQLGMQKIVQFSQQDVADLKLPEQYVGKRFDAVTCGSAIAMFQDPQEVVRVAASKILKPGGTFVVDMHGTHVPAKAFLDVAVPRGFEAPFDPAWMDKMEECLRKLFEHSAFEVRNVSSNAIAAGTMRWDVSSAEAIEKLWDNVVRDSVWVSFGVEKLSAEVLADIKQAWVEKLTELKGPDGFIVAHMTQCILVAVLRPHV